jgi:hypothetical protein
MPDDEVDELRERTGELDAGGTAPGDHEAQRPVVGRARSGRRDRRLLEALQHRVAQQGRLGERLQSERMLGDSGHTEVLGDRTRCDHEMVVGDLRRVTEPHGMTGRVDGDDLTESDLDLLASQDRAQRDADVLRLQSRGRDLVEQRLERVMVPTVDQRDARVEVPPPARTREPTDDRESTEAPTDDDDADGRRAGAVTRPAVRSPCSSRA